MENILEKLNNRDAIDKKILSALRANARISMQDLSATAGLSASPCIRRVRIMEEAGIITGYSVLLDEAQLGFKISVFLSVKLKQQTDDAIKIFEKSILEYPEVVDCWLMTGTRDYLMRVATTSLEGFEQFLTKKLTKISVVSSIESALPLRRVKFGIFRAN